MEKIIAKMYDSVAHLKARDLSIIGKALVLNTLVTSKLWHLIRIIPPSKDQIKRIHSMMRSFLWNDGLSSLSWDKVCLPRRSGGLGVLSVEHQAKALLIRFITPLIFREHFNRSFFHEIAEHLIKEATATTSHLIPIFFPELYKKQLKRYHLLDGRSRTK